MFSMAGSVFKDNSVLLTKTLHFTVEYILFYVVKFTIMQSCLVQTGVYLSRFINKLMYLFVLPTIQNPNIVN